MGENAVLTLELPGRPEAASAARTALRALNGDLHLISQPRLADAQLLLSELVANAVRASEGEPVTLHVHVTERTLRVEVANAGAAFDPGGLPEPSHERAGGWGLRIVDVVAQRWGVEPDDEGVRVWFEVDRPATESALPLSDDAPPPDLDRTPEAPR
jgi:anti-sigma regulatory factor (Ser/Thr protein kinase)